MCLHTYMYMYVQSTNFTHALQWSYHSHECGFLTQVDGFISTLLARCFKSLNLSEKEWTYCNTAHQIHVHVHLWLTTSVLKELKSQEPRISTYITSLYKLCFLKACLTNLVFYFALRCISGNLCWIRFYQWQSWVYSVQVLVSLVHVLVGEVH